MSKDSSKPSKSSSLLASQVRIIFYVLLVMLLAVIGVQVVVGIFMTFFPSAIGWHASSTTAWYGTPLANFLSILFSEFLAAATIWYVARLQKTPFRELVGLQEWRWFYPLLALAGVGIYFVLFAVVYAAVQGIIPTSNTQQALGFDSGIGGVGLWLAGIGLIVLPPIAEEIVFRGFFYGMLRRSRLSVFWSVLITSLAFGSLHLFTGESGLLWVALVDTFTLSVVLCMLREKTGSIWTGIFVHALKNGFVFLNLFIINNH
jgi:CAAX protease family protein